MAGGLQVDERLWQIYFMNGFNKCYCEATASI